MYILYLFSLVRWVARRGDPGTPSGGGEDVPGQPERADRDPYVAALIIQAFNEKLLLEEDVYKTK